MTRRKKRLIILAAIILFFVLVSTFTGLLPENSVLVLDLSGPIEEEHPKGPLGKATAPSTMVLHELTDAIDTARTDSRVVGLVVKISDSQAGLGKIQELRSHLMEFRKSNKPSICHLSGDLLGNRAYYLASACEQVWLVPTGSLGITGMMSSSVFLRGTLEKLGIYPDYYGIAEYKTARDLFTEKKYTPANREMTEAILRSAYRQFVNGVAEARMLEPADVEAAVKQGPYLTQEAIDRKLADRAAYWDEVQDHFKNKYGAWRQVELKRYLREVPKTGSHKIAVVHATGLILVGKSDYSPFTGFVMGSDSVAADLRKAREDESIKAVILRVDSPGGSAVASEVIRREVELTKAVKPVVVSMSDVAGSGGYWISMSANRILADPSTLTGSIGVVFGKMNISGFYRWLGLGTDHVATHENATMMWPHQNFTPSQREAILKFMREIYDNFKKGVAESREMTLDEVEKIARGRVWTGEQAKELRLVDEVSGFVRALEVAKELAKIDAQESVQIVRFPEERPFFVELMEALGNSRMSTEAALAAEVRRLVRLSEPVQVQMPRLAIQ